MSDYIMEEFNRLTKPGCIGFYNSCSITSVIVMNKKKQVFQNVYTIATFEEDDFRDYRLKYHTSSPVSLDRDQSLIVVSQKVTVEDAKNLFVQLYQKGTWQQPESQDHLTLSKLRTMNPQFVSVAENVPVASILKNAYRYSDYIFEFFSEEKPFLHQISPVLGKGYISSMERKIFQTVRALLPIDLEYIRDRWENVIFQLPVNLVRIDSRGDKDERHLLMNINWHPLVSMKPPIVTIHCHSEFDDLILGNSIWHGNEDEIKLFLGDTDGRITVRVMRDDLRTILFSSSATLLKKFNMSFDIISQDKVEISVPQRRNDEPPFTYQVQFKTSANPTGRSGDDWMAWIQLRTHMESIRRLTDNLEFVQYGAGGENERSKALGDIRSLVQRYGDTGVCLWDPYADGIDILSTLFACPVRGVPLRVITSYNREVRNVAKLNHGINLDYQQWVTRLRSHLQPYSKLHAAYLEVRCQQGSHGWSFHDRFLIFPRRKPLVWSLGASVNTLGGSHCIMMKVQHSQPVLDAFEDLWNQLGKCVVWP